MAARIHKIRHDEETRSRIQANQIINRLESHILGEVELKPTQITAALGLLRKVIPDLSVTKLTGDSENPIAIQAIGWLDAGMKIIENEAQHVPDPPALEGDEVIEWSTVRENGNGHDKSAIEATTATEPASGSSEDSQA